MKTCPKCKVRKPALEFSKCATRADGLQGECKSCCKQRRAQFQNTEPGKKYFRDYQAQYATTVKGRAYKLWRSATKRSDNVTITPQWVAEKLEKGICEMSGLALDLQPWAEDGSGRHPRSPSLDRIDGAKGYVPDNVRLVCWQVNLARNCYDDETLFEMCRAISSQGAKAQGSETISKESRGQAASKRLAPRG